MVAMPQAGKPGGRKDWLLLDVGYGHSSFYLYPKGSTPSASSPKTGFDRFRAVAAYDYFSSGYLIADIAARRRTSK